MTRRLAGCCAIATRSTARGSANESLVWVSERSCRVRPGHGGTREVDVMPTKYKHSTRKNHQHIMAKHLIPRSDPGWDDDANSLKRLAPQAGFEPATLRLTAGCSTVELLRNSARTDRFGPNLNSSESATPRAIRSSDRRGSPNAREGNRPSARHLSSI